MTMEARCKKCGAIILWATTPSGKQMPIDAEPSEVGNIELDGVRVRFVAPDRNATTRRYKSHFATCPAADAEKLERMLDCEKVAVRALVAERDKLCDECDRLRKALESVEYEFSRLVEWSQMFGKTLCPPGPDTYGEGVRDCKRQVSLILAKIDSVIRARGKEGVNDERTNQNAVRRGTLPI